MFTSKKKLRSEITRLQYRVDELEERLCPCESHKWKMVDFYLTGGTSVGDDIIVEKFKCERCGKKTEDSRWFTFE